MQRANIWNIILIGLGVICVVLACVKPYEPPEIKMATSLLVVDGLLQGGTNATATVKLSRTRRLADTDTSAPEEGARVYIESSLQQRFQLQEGPAGSYTATGLPLQANGSYRLFIETRNGTQAASELVQVLQTPEIDSLTWEENEGEISILVNTHDPQGKSRYYRWEYDETWEYRAPYDAIVGYENGVLFFRDSADLRYRCWRTAQNTGILLGASAQLAQDVISRKVLTKQKAATSKFGVRYSILVKQHALTKEAFEFWQILQKNTEQRGSLFDAQPSQLKGNIKNISNPEEPVLGLFSAASVTQKRLFIPFAEIEDKYRFSSSCSVKIVQPDSAIYYLDLLNLKPAYYITGGGLAISTIQCVDCTLQGGVNVKPSFW